MAIPIPSATEVSPSTQPALNVLGDSELCSSFESVIKSTLPMQSASEESKPTETHVACKYGARPGICSEGNYSVCTRF